MGNGAPRTCSATRITGAWRRGRDSNPRSRSSQLSRFRVVRLKPLSHPSEGGRYSSQRTGIAQWEFSDRLPGAPTRRAPAPRNRRPRWSKGRAPPGTGFRLGGRPTRWMGLSLGRKRQETRTGQCNRRPGWIRVWRHISHFYCRRTQRNIKARRAVFSTEGRACGCARNRRFAAPRAGLSQKGCGLR
jgi:hypothetical protein